MARSRNLSRIAESVDEVDRFAAELDHWFASAAECDALGRYTTQLAALSGVLRPTLARCRDHVVGLAPDRDSGAVRAKVIMKAGDVAAMPADIRHQGFSPKRSMLLVWENASPELPELIASGRAPQVPVEF